MKVGSSTGVFYGDDGLIRSWDPEWIQGVINILIGIFPRLGLIANVAKSNTTTCHPGEICTGMSEEDSSQNITS